MAINQANTYNYRRHEREFLKAKEEKERMIQIISLLAVAMLGIVVGAGVIMLLSRRRQGQMFNKVSDQLGRISFNVENITIRPEYEGKATSDRHRPSEDNLTCTDVDTEVRKRAEVEERRSVLREQLLNAASQNHSPSRPQYVETDIYRTLKAMAADGKQIMDDSLLWDKLEQTISKVSPNTLPTIRFLTCGQHTVSEWKTALLTIIGLSTSDMANLILRSRSTVDSRRSSLGEKMFGYTVRVPVVVNSLHLL